MTLDKQQWQLPWTAPGWLRGAWEFPRGALNSLEGAVSTASCLSCQALALQSNRAWLRVQGDADEEEIRRVYRKLALAHHPDKNVGREEVATKEFKKINESYRRLQTAEGDGSDSDVDLDDIFEQDPMDFFAHMCAPAPASPVLPPVRPRQQY